MLQHLQRAARNRQVGAVDAIGPVVPAVDLRKEASHSPRGRYLGQLGGRFGGRLPGPIDAD
jgi:hypothetical protein